jgi:drug/metabolite transporter (DMT)-like permease
MKKLGSVTANNYLYLQPPITMVAGYFFLGEKIFMLGYIGCALVIAGLIISDKWKGSIWFRKK